MMAVLRDPAVMVVVVGMVRLAHLAGSLWLASRGRDRVRRAERESVTVELRGPDGSVLTVRSVGRARRAGRGGSRDG